MRDVADLMHEHHAERLLEWMRRVNADNLPAPHSLITGMSRDLDAVTAGLTLPRSSGPIGATPTTSR